MKKINYIIWIFSFVFTGIVIHSCNKEENNFSDQQKLTSRSNLLTELEIFTLRNDFAQTLYNAMSNEPLLRIFIHNKIGLIQNDPDFELIYIAIKNEEVTPGKTFKSLLTQYADPQLLRDRGNDFFDKISNNLPLLKISMPDKIDLFGYEGWDKSIPPSVAAISDNDFEFNIYDALNPNGKAVFAEEIEQVYEHINGPVLSIMDAEIHYLVNSQGVMINGTNLRSYFPILPQMDRDPENPRDPNDPQPPDDDCFEYLLQAISFMDNYIISGERFWLVRHNQMMHIYYECISFNPDDPDEPDPCSEPCERDCEEKDEHLVKFRLANRDVFYNIDNQGPGGIWETRYVFHIDVLAARLLSNGQASPHNVKIVTPAYQIHDLYTVMTIIVPIPFFPYFVRFRKPINPKWINIPMNDGRWNQDWKLYDVGTPVWFDWHEVDNGTTETNLSFDVSAKFIKKDQQEVSATVKVGYKLSSDKIVPLGKKFVEYCDAIDYMHGTGSVHFYVD